MFDFNQFPVMFYRQDCRELTSNWPEDRKIALVKKMSKITLNDPKFYMGDKTERWDFPEITNRKFSATKIYAWMQELCFSVGMIDVDKEMTKMVNLFGVGKHGIDV